MGQRVEEYCVFRESDNNTSKLEKTLGRTRQAWLWHDIEGVAIYRLSEAPHELMMDISLELQKGQEC